MGDKSQKVLPAFQQMILSPQAGTVEIITNWLFRPQELTFTRAHSSLKQSLIRMSFRIWLSFITVEGAEDGFSGES